MRISFFVPVLFLLILNACRQKEELLTEKEVIEVINLFDKGWKTKNARLVDSVLSDRYLYFTQSGRTFDRAGILLTAASDIYLLQTMEREQFTVQIEGNTAVVNTVWKGKGSYHGEEFDDNQRCSITVVKHKGNVRILSEHCTPIRIRKPVTDL